jgi:hypothetical protein
MKDKEDQRLAAKAKKLAADYVSTVASRTAQVKPIKPCSKSVF